MLKYFACCIIFVVLFFDALNAQEKSFSTLEEAVNYHISELKSGIKQCDNIFVMVSLDSSIVFAEGATRVNCLVNTKLLNKKDKNFAIKFVVASTKAYVQIQAINFQLIKISRRKIKWVNLGNGQKYQVKPCSP